MIAIITARHPFLAVIDADTFLIVPTGNNLQTKLLCGFFFHILSSGLRVIYTIQKKKKSDQEFFMSSIILSK